MQLRDYQEQAVQSIYDAIIDGKKAPLVAMPTGTGKSLVIAGGIKRTCMEYPQTRHVVFTHVKELVQQNANKLRELWPQAPIGIHSAGLKKRDTMQPIIFGGCASAVNKLDHFGYRDFLWIDEAHLLSPTEGTTYQKIIEGLRAYNPNIIIVGTTATAYRRGQGMLTTGGIFDCMAIDLCDAASWQRFIAAGHLVPPIAKKTSAYIDTSGVGMQQGDYNNGQLQAVSDVNSLNHKIAREACAAGEGRRKWVTFCSGVEHAEHMAEIFTSLGVVSHAIHSKLAGGDAERDKLLADYRAGKIRNLTTNNMLTTGHDFPELDLIVMCRATVSTGLWVQMIGRGTRPTPGKRDCLVLDFARNVERLGPIDDPRIPGPKGRATGDIPIKLCPACDAYNHISARICCSCGEAFEIKEKLHASAGTAEILSADTPIVETLDVKRVFYVMHYKKDSGSQSVRIQYMCGTRMFNEWINFDKPTHRMHEFWRQRVGDENFPNDNSKALALLSKGIAVVPKTIRVWTNKRPYAEVLGYEF